MSNRKGATYGSLRLDVEQELHKGDNLSWVNGPLGLGRKYIVEFRTADDEALPIPRTPAGSVIAPRGRFIVPRPPARTAIGHTLLKVPQANS
jgi:hypothetical protein